MNASWHSDGVSVSYRLATSPAMQNAGELADSTTLAPMFSEEGGRVRIEHGLHQELRFEDNTASRRAMVAFYEDSVTESDHRRGRLCIAAGSCLGEHAYDPASQVFRVTGPGYTTGGFRAWSRKR